jgi:RepB DNA-primase from phage plasmid
VDRTTAVVTAQLAAMPSEVFEVGVFRAAPEPLMILRNWDSPTLMRSLNWLRFQNRNGRDIYVRPFGEHRMTLVDDLASQTIEGMKRAGFNPAVVVETSPGNFQAWLKHAEILPRAVGTAVARTLAERFGGDGGAADWRHFGRLAGFTNRKPKHLDSQTELHPFVRLIESSGMIYPKAEELLREVRIGLEKAAEERRQRSERAVKTLPETAAPAKTIDIFRSDPRYGGDNTRVDLAYALYALSHGVAAAVVSTALESRDLSHKGSEKRQNQYIERTIQKALRCLNGAGREL